MRDGLVGGQTHGLANGREVVLNEREGGVMREGEYAVAQVVPVGANDLEALCSWNRGKFPVNVIRDDLWEDTLSRRGRGTMEANNEANRLWQAGGRLFRCARGLGSLLRGLSSSSSV